MVKRCDFFQNHNEITLHTHKDGYYGNKRKAFPKSQEIPNVVKNMEILELLNTANRNVRWGSFCMTILQKMKHKNTI